MQRRKKFSLFSAQKETPLLKTNKQTNKKPIQTILTMRAHVRVSHILFVDRDAIVRGEKGGPPWVNTREDGKGLLVEKAKDDE